jgi:uncharacterized membrane protein
MVDKKVKFYICKNSLKNIMMLLMVGVLLFGVVSALTSSTTVGGVTAELSPNSSNVSNITYMNFTVNDTTNATSWYNITFPAGFDASGAVVDLNINGSSTPVNWTNNTGTLYVNISSDDPANVSADNNTVQYINLSNISVASSSTSIPINITTNNTITLLLNYTVYEYGVSLTNDTSTPINKTTSPATNATYILNLTNNGTAADSYNLTIDNTSNAGIAEVNISTTFIPLEAGETKIFSLNVSNTTAGTFLVNVTATSTNDTSKFMSVNTTTVVLAPVALGTAANFAILAGSGITFTTPNSTITGDIGSSPTPPITVLKILS